MKRYLDHMSALFLTAVLLPQALLPAGAVLCIEPCGDLAVTTAHAAHAAHHAAPSSQGSHHHHHCHSHEHGKLHHACGHAPGSAGATHPLQTCIDINASDEFPPAARAALVTSNHGAAISYGISALWPLSDRVQACRHRAPDPPPFGRCGSFLPPLRV
ncbi:MAG: hypothetical protein AAF581_12335 [Planctomycetota bacterium]